MKNTEYKKDYLKLCQENIDKLAAGTRSRLFAAFFMLSEGKKPGIEEFCSYPAVHLLQV